MVDVERICTGSRSSLTLSALMTHVMDPIVKIWPGYRRDEESTEKAILFDKEAARKPLPLSTVGQLYLACCFLVELLGIPLGGLPMIFCR